MYRSSSRFAAMWLLLMLPIACNQEKRCGLESIITLDGQPLENGYIQFLPIPPTQGQTHGGEIVAGRFVVPVSNGMLPGTYRVEITKLGKSGEKMPDPLGSGKTFDVHANIIPARYNSESELTVEVRLGVANRAEFALTSR